MGPWRDVRRAVVLLLVPVTYGIVGYTILGLGVTDAIYQTAITVTTVGYEEVGGPYGQVERLFTVSLLFVGVAAFFYAGGLLVQVVVERRLQEHLRERRMSKAIEHMSDHVVVCGYGRVGRTVAGQLARADKPVVVVDRQTERVVDCGHPHVVGEATEDDVLEAAGVRRAATLVTALDTDEANLFVAMTARAMNPKLFIVARAREESALPKLLRAGADRVVNPQQIGGDRMVALTLQPAVAEFLDVVVHEGGFEFRLEELVVREGFDLAGRSLRDAHIRDRTGALVLALKNEGGFVSNPDPSTVITPGDVMVAIGTPDQLGKLTDMNGGRH